MAKNGYSKVILDSRGVRYKWAVLCNLFLPCPFLSFVVNDIYVLFSTEPEERLSSPARDSSGSEDHSDASPFKRRPKKRRSNGRAAKKGKLNSDWGHQFVKLSTVP